MPPRDAPSADAVGSLEAPYDSCDDFNDSLPSEDSLYRNCYASDEEGFYKVRGRYIPNASTKPCSEFPSRTELA